MLSVFVKVYRDKDYFYTRGNPNSKVLYFKANQNGEAEVSYYTSSATS